MSQGWYDYHQGEYTEFLSVAVQNLNFMVYVVRMNIGSSHQPMNTSEASVADGYASGYHNSTAGGPQPVIFICCVDIL